ncbi:hypothetical protein ID866_4437 [Astraeus odoratus]|nr:hypothetical protein ID866_4437 [Astraeus odoratus]
MAVEPGTEPADLVHEVDNQEEFDDESDVYSVEGDEEDDSYQVNEGEEDEDEDEDEESESEEGRPPTNLTAQLLRDPNPEPEDEEDDYGDYQDEHDGEGTADDPIDLASEVSSTHTGTKRGVRDLTDDDGEGDDDDDVSESAPKRAKV